MKFSKSEKILFGTFSLLSAIIILYNLFYIPSLPDANIIKKDLNFQSDENFDKEEKSIGKININSAKIEELKKIPGIGESIAEKIVEYRETNGGFSSISEIMNVSGIGQKKFDAMKDYICIK